MPQGVPFPNYASLAVNISTQGSVLGGMEKEDLLSYGSLLVEVSV